MDGRIDLTLNRDFSRRRRKGPYDDIPRSIFKRNEVDTRLSNFIPNGTTSIPTTSTTITTTSGTFTTINNNWFSLNNNMLIGNSYNNGEICDSCGKDITRIPWQREARGCLCRKCFKKLKDNIKRIPWK